MAYDSEIVHNSTVALHSVIHVTARKMLARTHDMLQMAADRYVQICCKSDKAAIAPERHVREGIILLSIILAVLNAFAWMGLMWPLECM